MIRILILTITLFLFLGCKAKRKALDEITRDEKKQLFSYLYVDGVSARLRSDYSMALEKMEQCRRIFPNEPAVYYETALSLHFSGKTREALLYAERAYLLYPKNIWYGLFYADLLAVNGNLTTSVAVKEKIHRDFPKDYEVCLKIAEDYKKLGQILKSLEWLNRAENITGIQEEITLEKISLLQEKKNTQQIIKEYEKLIHSDSTEVRFLNYLADFYLNNHQWKEASDIYDKIFRIHPDYPPALISIAGYHVDRKNFQEGMEYILKLINATDADISIKSKVLSALEISYMENTSSTVLQNGLKFSILKLYELSPNQFESNYWMSKYYSIYNTNKDSAVYFLKACLNYDKSRPDIFKNVVEYYINNKWWDSAYKYSKEPAELYPNDPFFHQQKGIAAYYLNRYSESVNDLKYAMEIPGISKKEIITSLFYLAKAYDKLKMFHESDLAHENILKMNPDYAPALNNYAWMLFERKSNVEKAEKMAKKALDLYPDSPQYADTYGCLLMLNGKYSDALEKFKLAHSLYPEKPFYIEHIGDALFMLGKTKEALEYWNKALEKGGDNAVLSKKIKVGLTGEYSK